MGKTAIKARDAMNRRLYKRLIIVETAIYRVFVIIYRVFMMIYRIFSDLELSSTEPYCPHFGKPSTRIKSNSRSNISSIGNI